MSLGSLNQDLMGIALSKKIQKNQILTHLHGLQSPSSEKKTNFNQNLSSKCFVKESFFLKRLFQYYYLFPSAS